MGLLILVDGKHGARRFICAGLDGSVCYKDFGVSLLTRCVSYAPPKSHFRGKCKPTRMNQFALIPQLKVLGVEAVAGPDDIGQEIRYLVECKEESDVEVTFEALLPRSEVRADLLAQFGHGALPTL